MKARRTSVQRLRFGRVEQEHHAKRERADDDRKREVEPAGSRCLQPNPSGPDEAHRRARGRAGIPVPCENKQWRDERVEQPSEHASDGHAEVKPRKVLAVGAPLASSPWHTIAARKNVSRWIGACIATGSLVLNAMSHARAGPIGAACAASSVCGTSVRRAKTSTKVSM